MKHRAGNPYAGVAERLELARALPAAAYADPAVFEAEAERVLKAGWLPVARESEIANPGDFVCADLVGTPLMATRGADGATHVLSRVCRHRGFILAQGKGNVRSLTCPYHLWRYGLDGALISAPAMQGSEAFEAGACSLKAFRHERWGGWILVNLGGEAAPLAERLGPLQARLAACQPERMITTGVLTFDSPWNWKVMVENFMESYHHIGPHSATLQQTNPGLGTHPGEWGETFTILENPPAGPDNAPFIVAAVFPLTLMYFSEGAPIGLWYEIADITPARFTLNVHLLASPELAASEGFAETMKARVTTVHLEDIPACEGVQKGVTSGIYEPGPLSPLEGCLWHFHRHLQECFR
ncbi:MAG TPA: aromatic ring-hydroxylating dioxygenase subunit alpha [Caulobacteraceae bacterium]|nr:aromatic ring-hydroxylating dioxygenase subunit alpha [Caulobacteraceae bacterium]